MGISSSLGSSALLPAGLGFRNLIINGAMNVDQRGTATAAATVNGYYTDRWYIEDGCDAVLSSQQSTDVPTGQGFRNSLKVTATTADASIGSTQFAVITQHIEGNNSAQLAWGTAGAKQIAVSFWVKASVAGTYSFTVYNNGASRICPTAYTVDSANTWEKKVVFVSGDTSGTWLTDTGRGITVNFYIALGSSYLGTSGVWNSSNIYGVAGQANALASTNNIFAITGVQLEQNYQATPFEQRPIGVELALCQRYFAKLTGGFWTIAQCLGSNTGYFLVHLPTDMRIGPTGVITTGTFVALDAGGVGRGITVAYGDGRTNRLAFSFSGGFNLNAGNAALIFSSGTCTIETTGVEL
jgi:hypothetical protein